MLQVMRNATNKLVVAALFIGFIIIATPYIVHENTHQSGVIIDSRNVYKDSLPQDLNDILDPDLRYTYLLIKENAPRKEVLAIVAGNAYSNGDVVEIPHAIIDWKVVWYKNNFIDAEYDSLIIGYVKEMGTVESIVERVLSIRSVGTAIFYLSKACYITNGLVFALLASYLLKGQLTNWTIPAMLSCYSFEVLLELIVASIHNVEIFWANKLFGASLMIFLPITILLCKYEENPVWRQKIKNFFHISRS